MSLKKYIDTADQPLDGTPEVMDYLKDERLLRVLLERKIFTFRSIQKEAIKKGLFFRQSFLVCAPSGSGKTLIGELCAIHGILNRFGKSIYLVPFKALASEKYHYILDFPDIMRLDRLIKMFLKIIIRHVLRSEH